MPWPPDIQEAENRMNAAKDALLADVESGRRTKVQTNLPGGRRCTFSRRVAQLLHIQAGILDYYRYLEVFRGIASY